MLPFGTLGPSSSGSMVPESSGWDMVRRAVGCLEAQGEPGRGGRLDKGGSRSSGVPDRWRQTSSPASHPLYHLMSTYATRQPWPAYPNTTTSSSVHLRISLAAHH